MGKKESSPFRVYSPLIVVTAVVIYHVHRELYTLCYLLKDCVYTASLQEGVCDCCRDVCGDNRI